MGAPLDNVPSSTANNTGNTDQDDNGINPENQAPPQDYAADGVVSNLIALVRNGAPTGESDLGPQGNGANGETDNNANLTVDFGFVPGEPYSLGNRVWFDANRDGLIDLATETGLNNVRVSLYRDGNNDGQPDGAAIATDTTDTTGYYLFDRLTPGRYLVGIDAVNFLPGGRLVGFASTIQAGGAPAGDLNDNRSFPALPPAGQAFDPILGLLSNSVLLTADDAPQNETNLSLNPADGPDSRGNNGEADENSDLTVDFGFYRPLSIGNRVWFDTNNSGQIDGGEVGISNVTVELYADETGPGGVPDGLPDTPGAPLATDFTDGGGYYLFSGLLPGNYVVAIANENFAPGAVLAGYDSSTDLTPPPALTTDRRDRGGDVPDAEGNVLSPTLTLVQDAAPTGETDTSGQVSDGPNFRGVNNESDNNSFLTVDFGFFSTPMSLGNVVWLDDGGTLGSGGTAGDGILNGDEAGLGGWLCSSLQTPTTTATRMARCWTPTPRTPTASTCSRACRRAATWCRSRRRTSRWAACWRGCSAARATWTTPTPRSTAGTMAAIAPTHR
ncbi:MAG: hypothetical protein HC915_17965 [Anaerolineae bacterium]|nr:hypothetical protein [Anaerolineae bacterium]